MYPDTRIEVNIEEKNETKRIAKGKREKGRVRRREREREKKTRGPTENYKLCVVPNRPSKIIPARPEAIMNM